MLAEQHQTESEPQSFVAVIDGSEPALRALAPAIALADWYNRPLAVYAVTAGPEDVDTHTEVARQISRTAVDLADVVFVPKRELDTHLFELMQHGHTPVASAFGVWAADGRLHGMLNGLVSHNAPAVVAIGPNVPHDWAPTSTHPVVVCVDGTDHARDLVKRIDPYIAAPKNPLVVLHVTNESPPNELVAKEVAAEIESRCDVPVEAVNVEGYSIPAAVSGFAAESEAQMLIMHSWHRPRQGHPVVSSSSVTSVAHATCPVVILSAQ